MITVTSHISIRLVVDLVWGGVCHMVPNRYTFAILVPCAFNLIGAGTHTPLEVFGKSAVARGCDARSVKINNNKVITLLKLLSALDYKSD